MCSTAAAAAAMAVALQGVYPIAREAWASIHEIYGAQCYETPLVRAEWLRERAEAAQVGRRMGWLGKVPWLVLEGRNIMLA